MQKFISSLQNPLVKQMVQLSEKSRERKKQGLFVVEGQREITLAVKGQYALEVLLVCEEILPKETFIGFRESIPKNIEPISISKEVYEKIAYRSGTEGVIAMFKEKEHRLSSIVFAATNPLILVAEAPEKPGNIGALLRTADAARLDAVIIANPKTDLYNPNIVRSSVGCLFTNQVAVGSTEEIIRFLKEQKLDIYCATLQASIEYTSCDFKKGCALVVGTEAAGLSHAWLTHSDQNIVIPMRGEIDSMNVSVAAGILIFEALRQRKSM